jgi:hypothetical protein
MAGGMQRRGTAKHGKQQRHKPLCQNAASLPDLTQINPGE